MDEIRETQETQETSGTRGGCLTAFLIFMLIANSVSSLTYLFAGSMLSHTLKSLPTWTMPVMAVLGLFNIICAIGIWKWKKWGIYGNAITTIAAFIINISIGISIINSLLGFVGFIILILLVRPIWKHLN